MSATKQTRDANPVPIGAVIDELKSSYPSMSHSSLRFLEREGLVIPHRTAGGHRLYSRADIRRIKQIKNWQADRLSLHDIRDRLDRFDRLEPTDLGDHFLDASIEGRGVEATRLALSADDAGMPLHRLLQDVLQPALVTVGDRWQSGEIVVAQEKEISEAIRALIAELGQRHAPRQPNGSVALAACVVGERHDLGLRMVVALLAEQGWTSHFLGADVEPRFIGEAVRLRRPDQVLLSVTMDDHLFSALAPTIEAITLAYAERARPRILVGGPAVARHPEQVRALGAEPIVHASIEQVLAVFAPN